MKRMILTTALGALCLSAFASYKEAPPAFSYKNSKAIFIDFEEAHYQIDYNVPDRSVEVSSVIRFTSYDSGHPIFDLVPTPSEVLLNGAEVLTQTASDPDQETTFRIIQEKIRPGLHELRIKHKITTNVVYGNEGVASGYWMSDLNDRRYLEQYLPTNMEYDQYSMKMSVNILGAQGRPHELKVNGKVTKIAENSYEVELPSFYTASSVYFHLFPRKNRAANVQFYYSSIDGRLIPVDIYTIYNPAKFASATKTILEELENDYGPFPHEKLIIFGNAPSGGMEYSGATITSFGALGHELFHCYHARGMIPANGNAGWMDEAIARWRDNKYPLVTKLNFDSTRLAGHSRWTRKTDRMAYTEGSAFLSWIAHRMDNKGLSFKTFLRDYFEKYKYTTVTTELFQKELSEAAGMDLSQDFKKYIYGNPSFRMKSMKMKSFHMEDPNHPHWTKQQLLDMTWI